MSKPRWTNSGRLLVDAGVVVATATSEADAERLAETLNDHALLARRVGALRSEIDVLTDRRRTP